MENINWKELGLLVFVWVAFLGLQIAKVLFLMLILIVKVFSPISINALSRAN